MVSRVQPDRKMHFYMLPSTLNFSRCYSFANKPNIRCLNLREIEIEQNRKMLFHADSLDKEL